ncbi:MAG: hypothetical protein M3Y13_05670, partial [Armatimonadota bacterium]|nr:hypothetical protein [Armatimonadota bacterium]
MNSQLPRRFGKAIPIAVSAAFLAAGLTSTAMTPAFARPAKRPVKRPAPLRRAKPLAPVIHGRAADLVQTLLIRDDLPVMGSNNGVRLWVHGDGSGANLRVRVLAPTLAASSAADAMPRDEWISTPIPITFTGWRETVIPEAKFSRRSATPLPMTFDPALPAEA